MGESCLCQRLHPASYYACTHRKTNTTFIGRPIRHTHMAPVLWNNTWQRTPTRLQQGSSGFARKKQYGDTDLKSVVQPHILLSAFFSLFLVIIFCLCVHAKQPNWRHGLCNEKHPPHLLFHFCVFSCLNPFVFLSLYLCLIDAMSLFEFVWFGCAAVNIISTHQFHLTLHFSPSSVPSLYFFISVVISICMLFLCIASSLPQFFP